MIFCLCWLELNFIGLTLYSEAVYFVSIMSELNRAHIIKYIFIFHAYQMSF